MENLLPDPERPDWANAGVPGVRRSAGSTSKKEVGPRKTPPEQRAERYASTALLRDVR